MNDRTGRRKKDAASAILFPLLFDIDRYLKRYVGGLAVIRRWILTYRRSRDFGLDDERVSFTVCRFSLSSEMTSRSIPPLQGGMMCKVHASRIATSVAFNLRV